VSNGERYQLSDAQVSASEVSVKGNRVVTPTKNVTLPWSEKVRYTKGKSLGYHGGGSLQEVVIPLGIFINSDDELEGWSEVPKVMPSWWDQEVMASNLVSIELDNLKVEQPKVEKKKTAKAKKIAAISEVVDDMFGRSSVVEPSVADSKSKGAHANWVGALFDSAVYQSIKSRSGRGIKDEQLHAFLELMNANQGQVMEAMVIRQLSIPKLRIRGFLSGAQKLLNVDGYPILSVERDSQTVKLNINDLKQQFEL
jgi:hypothetical protein